MVVYKYMKRNKFFLLCLIVLIICSLVKLSTLNVAEEYNQEVLNHIPSDNQVTLIKTINVNVDTSDGYEEIPGELYLMDLVEDFIIEHNDIINIDIEVVVYKNHTEYKAFIIYKEEVYYGKNIIRCRSNSIYC